MKFLSKHWLQAGCIGAVRISDDMLQGMPVQAAELDSMEEQSSQLEDELASTRAFGSGNADRRSGRSDEATNGQIEATQAQIDIAKIVSSSRFEEMKLRIRSVCAKRQRIDAEHDLFCRQYGGFF